MKVSEAVLREWNNRKKRGDITNICSRTGFSRVTVTKALNGEASAELIMKISEYYSDKENINPKEVEAQALKLLNKKLK